MVTEVVDNHLNQQSQVQVVALEAQQDMQALEAVLKIVKMFMQVVEDHKLQVV